MHQTMQTTREWTMLTDVCYEKTDQKTYQKTYQKTDQKTPDTRPDAQVRQMKPDAQMRGQAHK